MELKASTGLMVTSLLLITSCCLNEVSGIIVTRKVSATFRVVNEVSRTIFVWLASIYLYEYSYIDNWMKYIGVTVFRLFSYCLLIFGNILINEITDIGIFNLDRYYGRYNETREEDSLNESGEF